MSNFEIAFDWLASGNDVPEIRQTMAQLTLRAGGVLLTQNEDIWSRTVRDSVLVSAYPLAMWLATSWWRLLHEPLPLVNSLSIDWRMAHEPGAAGAGFVWPKMAFASDQQHMHIWAVPSNAQGQQSVRYLNGLPSSVTVTLSEFTDQATSFIAGVLARLAAVNIQHSDLAGLWQEVTQERFDPEASLVRRLEAEMGYDPDECPEAILQQARALAKKMGEATLSEILPIDGKAVSATPLANIQAMMLEEGLIGKFDIPKIHNSRKGTMPWQRAVADARALREEIGITGDGVKNSALYDLLGLRGEDVEGYAPDQRGKAALAMPVAENKTKILLRKGRPVSRRFELARVIADAQDQAGKHNGKPWLAVTDIATARQKYQRAFAAEFLCPIDKLVEVLEGDYSGTSIENGAEHFDVSVLTVQTLLRNNGKIDRSDDGPYRPQGPGLPYAVAAW